MIITVPILMRLDGVESDASIAEWLMSKPLDYIMKVRFMIHSGIGFIGLAAVLSALNLFR